MTLQTLSHSIENIDISGSGGKGGGGGHTPVESNDTLQSTQVVRVLLALGQGEINNIEEVYLNKVPIASFNASYEVRYGTSNQSVIKGFINTEAPLNPFSTAEITTTTPGGPYTIDANADAVRLIFFTPNLSKYQENGDLVGTQIELSIRTSLDNNFYTEVTTSIKKGKSSSEYAWDVIVERPAAHIAGNPWYVKVVRMTADSTSVKLNNQTHIANVVQIYYEQKTYPGIALLGVTVNDAAQFGGSVPEILVKGKFLKVKVPDNYDPNNRIYYGNWTSLAFNPVKQFTDNIAWVIFYCLTDPRALAIPEADIDKASFYDLSLYSDMVIDDGYGGTTYRYTIGFQFIERENVPSFLANLLSICNATLANNELGQITIVFDKPNVQPTKLITNANVIDGTFNYSSSDLEARTTLVNVTYNDFDNFGQTDTATIPSASPTAFEQGLQDRYGLQTIDILLPGCTKKAQAIRKARNAFYTNCMNTKFISFKVFMQGLTFYYGEFIEVMDDDNQQVIQSGVIVSSSSNSGTVTITLDRAITLSSYTWTISYTRTDGTTIQEATLAQTSGTFTQLSFVSAYLPLDGTVFILKGAVQSKIYKVTGIEKEDNFYVIAGVEHDEAKYSYIENGIVLDVPTGDFVNVSSFVTEAVTNVTVVPISSRSTTRSKVQLHVHWDWDLDHSERYKATFIANWKRDNQNFAYIKDIEGQSFDIEPAVPGIYEINIWAVSPVTGLKSVVVNTVYSYKVNPAQSTLFPPTNIRVTGTSGLEFQTAALSLSFDNNAANFDNVEDSLYDYTVEIYTTGIVLKGTYTVNPDAELNGLFYLSFAENTARFGTPTRQFVIRIYARDLDGFLSAYSEVTVLNPAPVISSFSATPTLDAAYLKATLPSDPDITGFTFRKYTAASGGTAQEIIPSKSNIIDFPATTGITYYYTATASDVYGEGSETTRYGVTAISATFDTYTYSGLQFTPNATTNKVSWSAFEYSKNGETPISVPAGIMATAWTSGVVYLYLNTSTNTVEQTLLPQVAVTGRILATYKGGTNLTSDEGRAYMDGDQIIAGSMLASAFAADVAYFTNLVQLGNLIQSQNYSWTAGNYHGWRIDNDGLARFTSIEIRDPTTGNLVMSSGTGWEWNYITGTGKPEPNATYGADGSNLNIAVGGNLLPNSDFVSPNIDQWVVAYNPSGGTGYTIGRDLAGVTYQPAGGHTIGFYRSGTTGAAANWFYIQYNTYFQVYAGAIFEVSAYMAAHRCTGGLVASWYDSSNTYLSETIVGQTTATGGQDLTNWARVGGLVTAPTNAARAYIQIRGGATTSNDPNVWATKIFFAKAKTGQSQLSPWQASGASGAFAELNKVTSGNVTTYIDNVAINNAQIANLDAGKISTGYLAAARLQAGVAYIKDGMIDNLAVNTANIKDLAVDTLKIAGQAVTVTSYSISNTPSFTLNIPTGATVLLQLSATSTSGSSSSYIALKANGVELGRCTLNSSSASERVYFVSTIYNTAGSITFSGEEGGLGTQTLTLIAFMGKK